MITLLAASLISSCSFMDHKPLCGKKINQEKLRIYQVEKRKRKFESRMKEIKKRKADERKIVL